MTIISIPFDDIMTKRKFYKTIGDIMVKYELLPTISLQTSGARLRSQTLPELVHMDDPAFVVMTDFSQSTPLTISPDETMDDALDEMKVRGVHLLLVTDAENNIIGLISSEDILGEKPIQIIQENRIQRAQVLVKMIMVPIDKMVAFDEADIEHARVGNIVATMQELRTHYALVVQNHEEGKKQTARGLFNTSQISKQLHQNITSAITKAQTLSELQKRHSKE